MKTRMHPEFSKWSKRILIAGFFSITLPVPGLYLTDLISDLTTTTRVENREDFLKVEQDIKKTINEECARLNMNEKVGFRLSSKLGAGVEEYSDGSKILRIGYNCANPTTIRHELWHFRSDDKQDKGIETTNNSLLMKLFDEYIIDESSAIFYSVVGYKFYPLLYQ